MSNKVVFVDKSTHLTHWGIKDNTLILLDKSSFLSHAGIRGMKWGVRNWQNYDGTFNEAGKLRYFGTTSKRGENHAANLSDEELSRAVKRMTAEFNYSHAARSRYETARAKKAKKSSAALDTISKTTGAISNTTRMLANAKKLSGESGGKSKDGLALASSVLSVVKAVTDLAKKSSDSKSSEIAVTRLMRDLSNLDDDELIKATSRIQLENSYNSFVDSSLPPSAIETFNSVMDTIGKTTGSLADVFNKTTKAKKEADKPTDKADVSNKLKHTDLEDGEALIHYGTKGQKWGVRNWQNLDGTYTEAGKERYFGDSKERNRIRSQAIRKTGYRKPEDTDSVYEKRRDAVTKMYDSSVTQSKIDELIRKVGPATVSELSDLDYIGSEPDKDEVHLLFSRYKITRSQFVDFQIEEALQNVLSAASIGAEFSKDISDVRLSEISKLKNIENFSDEGKRQTAVIVSGYGRLDNKSAKELLDEYGSSTFGISSLYDAVPGLLEAIPGPGSANNMTFDESVKKIDGLIEKHYDDIEKAAKNNVDNMAKEYNLNQYDFWLSKEPGYELIKKEREHNK